MDHRQIRLRPSNQFLLITEGRLQGLKHSIGSLNMPCWWLRKISQAKDEAQIILPEVLTSVNKFSIFWSWNGYKLFGCLLLIMAIIQHLGLNLRSFRLLFSLNYKHYIIILYCITYLFAFFPTYYSLIFFFICHSTLKYHF